MEKKEYNQTSLTQAQNNLYGLYDEKIDSTVDSFYSNADELNNQINILKNKNIELWESILQKLKIDWTFNSNSIEGSTLTRGETHFFLTEGVTVEENHLKILLIQKTMRMLLIGYKIF